MTKSIRLNYFFHHQPESVWKYLTTPELMSQWLMLNDFKPIAGHEFQFTTKPVPALELDGIFHCKVLEIVPLEKLTYSWKGGAGDGQVTLDTVVVWILTEKDNGTELFLEHSGFREIENLDIYNGMSNGWLQNVQKIAERLNAAKHDPSIEDIGRERYCTLREDGFNNLQEWIDFFDSFWKTKLKKLESLLNNKTK